MPADWSGPQLSQVTWLEITSSHQRNTNLNSLKTHGLGSRSFLSENQPVCSYFRQPKPFILDKQGRHGRGFMAWNMSDYEDTTQRNSKWAVLVRQSKLPSPRASKPSKLPKLTKTEAVWPIVFLNHHRNNSAWFKIWSRECLVIILTVLQLLLVSSNHVVIYIGFPQKHPFSG